MPVPPLRPGQKLLSLTAVVYEEGDVVGRVLAFASLLPLMILVGTLSDESSNKFRSSKAFSEVCCCFPRLHHMYWAAPRYPHNIHLGAGPIVSICSFKSIVKRASHRNLRACV